jgi:hypothetical protein
MNTVRSGSTFGRTIPLVAVVVLAAMLVACQASPAETRTISLTTLNGSGVSGSVTLTALDNHRTQVEIRVDPAGHPDMPSHIHPGTCQNLVPQPKYPLKNVMQGHSITIVPAAFVELLHGDLAVNIHKSNQDLATYTACADLH